MLASWDRTTFDADGLTGERLNFTDYLGRLFATVVVWPGRATRVFWVGGRTTDYYGRGSRAVAVEDVETAAEAEDRRGLLTKINERRAARI